MVTNYSALRRENIRRYGEDSGRWGRKLLQERYGDRNTFVYELLQNAEDALARRSGWRGERSVRFQVSARKLLVRHYGAPFDEADVRGICGIAEGTKTDGLTEIGRFGIGFKSVYAFTERPEVHSGAEHFAIEDYVRPGATPPLDPQAPEETVFVLPLQNAQDEETIRTAVREFAPRALLFLREIAEIQWDAEDASGLYLRETEALGEGVRRVDLVGEAAGQQETAEQWLVFSRPAPEAPRRFVEIAFRLRDEGRVARVPTERTPLYAFFPTTLPTGLAFRVQGPFRTTLARDNVPVGDPWNEQLVRVAAGVLTGALRWLSGANLLDAAALECLPLGAGALPEGSMLAPLGEAAARALREEPLLPRSGGGFVAGKNARVADPRWLRDLFDREQLSVLFGGDTAWLSEDLSRRRFETLRRATGVSTVRPDAALGRLDAGFLAAQTDGWMRRLYECLGGQRSLHERAKRLPLIRLMDGSQVAAARARVFLPTNGETGLPTVRRAVCDSSGAMAFLRALGLSESDPTDRALLEVLPKYGAGRLPASEEEYAADLRELARAYRESSAAGRRRLEAELRRTPLVRTVDPGTGDRRLSRPAEARFAPGSDSEDPSELTDANAVRLVDEGCEVLREAAIRGLLERSGTRPFPRRVGEGARAASSKERDAARRAPVARGEVKPPADAGGKVRVLPRSAADGAPGPEERLRRESVEEQAVELILRGEPGWVREPPGAAGFDLWRTDAAGRRLFCEVKALSGSLDDYPARLTSAQFRCALDRGDAYWLYIVENVGGGAPSIIRISDPARRAVRFGFGPEWREFSEPPP